MQWSRVSSGPMGWVPKAPLLGIKENYGLSPAAEMAMQAPQGVDLKLSREETDFDA